MENIKKVNLLCDLHEIILERKLESIQSLHKIRNLKVKNKTDGD